MKEKLFVEVVKIMEIEVESEEVVETSLKNVVSVVVVEVKAVVFYEEKVVEAVVGVTVVVEVGEKEAKVH